MGLFDFLIGTNSKSSNLDESTKITSMKDEVLGDYGSSIIQMKNYNVWDLISKLRDLNDNYKYRYREYEAMTNEVTIQAAIELYADDATQVDTKSEKIIGVSSDDKTLQQDLNDFLESVNVESSVWNWAYAVAQYGDFFIKLHVDESDNSIHIDDSIDPASVIDLFEQGQRVGFAEEDTSDYKNLKHKSNPNGLDLIIYSPDRFVHFMIKRSSEYDNLEIPIQDETDENGDPLIRKFTIVRGISMVEGVRSIYRMLQLLEDSLITARVTKAEYIRVFNIEVGDSTPKQAAETVNTAKNLFDSKATFDTRNNTYRSDKIYRPMGDPVFNPTRNGKGALSIESIGGDFQVKDIADLDYFKNKLFSGLKIPSAYLGYEECFRYDTKVTLLNGSTYEIGYMAEHPEDFIGLGILSCSPNGEIIPTRIVHVKQTRKNATFVRVHLDNGEYIDVTPDHLMMMRDGSFQEAGSLSEGDSLMPCYTEYYGGRKYIKDNTVNHTRWLPQYRLVAKHLLNEGIEVPPGHQVHHKDRVKCNDDPTNLEILTTSEHAKEHKIDLLEARKRKGFPSPSPETRALISKHVSEALKGHAVSDEQRHRLSELAKSRTDMHFKSGEDNILNSNPEAKQRHLEARRAYFDNGGSTWQKTCDDQSKLDEWKSKIQESRWPVSYERKSKLRVLKCDRCGSEFTKSISDEDYIDYSLLERNAYCSKECMASSRNLDRARKLYKDLDKEYGYVDESLYNLHKPCNFMRYDTLMENLDRIYSQRECYNHKVVKVELLDVIEDAYDLGVEHENHTFALTAGVFVHNSLPGGLGEETLTRLDIRYSRSVKRVQNAIIVGIRDLCNIWLRLNGRESDVNNFKIILQAPSTAEELGRLTEFSTKMNTINEITSTLSSNYGDYINLPKVFKVLFDKFINYPELIDGLEPELNAAIERYEQHLKDEVTRRKAEVDELTQSSDRDY